ncbi:MAG: cytochrome c [Gemmatimonadaceae bacterium]
MRRRAALSLLAPLAAALLVAACELRDAQDQGGGSPAGAGQAQQGGVGRPADVDPPTELPRSFAGIGRVARTEEVRAWDIDVNPAGVGLPPGRGTHAQGARVYAQHCAVCHGAAGEGVAPNPPLVGAGSGDFAFANDPKLTKTLGNYWPYATTLYDYVNRAMPFVAPGSLTAAEVYAVVAYLLAENGVIGKETVLDARSLAAVRMPARGRFVHDDRAGGAVFR